MRLNLLSGLALMSLTFLTTACSRSPQVSFYTLEPAATLRPLPSGQTAPSVLVGPVTIPATEDRSQLVVRLYGNRVDVLESERWAEPLKSGIPRLIALDLGRLLGSDRVASSQEISGAGADYRVLVDFVRFESTAGEGVTVDARWTVRRAGGTRKVGRSLVHEKAKGAGYDGVVAAYGRALDAVSGDLARAIRAEEAARP